ncbi:MAG: hypothetical protein HY820_11620 [Acidobacteria bacterium]|nr:hypothetical protein [Acidobacteriota bacterium]
MKSPPNPYVGPRSYRDGERLYGRQREIANLTNLLLSERIVLLYSPSGAGKSSLLQAGLMPSMRNRGFTVRPVVRVNNDPPAGTRINRYTSSTIDFLNLEGRSHAASLQEYLDPNPNGELLLFDQFEEVLTTDPVGTRVKEDFFRQLGEVLQSPGRWAVFAMREDHLAALDPYLRYIPTRFSSTFRLDLLKGESALQAIRGPAEQCNVMFELEAAAQIYDDLCQVKVPKPGGGTENKPGEFVEPILLQVVCLRRWENLPEGTSSITPLPVPSAGDPEEKQLGALALEEYFSTVTEGVASRMRVSERTIRDWFEDRLITKLDTRGQVLVGDGLDENTVEELRKAHVVRIEPRNGSDWVELAHDRLIRPIKDSNKLWDQQHLTFFQREAALWDDQGQPESRLLTKDALAAAEGELPRIDSLTAIETEFLEESRKAERARILADERRLKDLRTARTLKILLAIAVVALLTAGAAAIWAWHNRNQAIQSAAEANAALAESDLDKTRTFAQAGQKAHAMAFLARALQLAPSNEQARLWAASFLGHALPLIPDFEVNHGTPVTHIAFSADGTRLFTMYERGQTKVWDREGRPVSGALPAGNQIIPNADGTLAVVYNTVNVDDWTGHVIDVATGKDLHASPDSGMLNVRLTAATFLPGTRNIFVTAGAVPENDPGGEWIWDLDTAQRRKPTKEEESIAHATTAAAPVILDPAYDMITARDARTVAQLARVLLNGKPGAQAVSPDGRLIAASVAGTPTVKVWSIPQAPANTDRPTMPPSIRIPTEQRPFFRKWNDDLQQNPNRRHYSHVLSDDGALMLVLRRANFFDDAPPEVFNTTTGERTAQIRPGGSGKVPDGTSFIGALSNKYAAVADSRGFTLLYDLSSKREIRSLTEPYSKTNPILVTVMRFSPDARLLATVDSSGWARLWESASGFEIGLPFATAGRAKRIEFSPDSKRIFVESEQGVTSWELLPGSGTAQEAAAIAARAQAAGGMRLIKGSSTPQSIPLAERKALILTPPRSQ